MPRGFAQACPSPAAIRCKSEPENPLGARPMKIQMKIICLVLGLLVTTTLARAEDVASMISQYRQAHGLAAVRTDAELTAVAERQARAMAKGGVMDHNVAGPFAARVANVRVGAAGENLAEGTKTWAETMKLWE